MTTPSPGREIVDGGLDLWEPLVLLPWVLSAVLALAVVVLSVLVARQRRRRTEAPRPPEPPVTPPVAAAPVPAASGVGPDEHDAWVVAELLTLDDLVATPAPAAQVRRMLRQLGVVPITPEQDEPLDLSLHEVVATRPSTDPAARDLVAGVHRTGWRRGAEVLRPAAVEVWTTPP